MERQLFEILYARVQQHGRHDVITSLLEEFVEVRYEALVGMLSTKVQRKTKYIAPWLYKEHAPILTTMAMRYVGQEESLVDLARCLYLEERGNQREVRLAERVEEVPHEAFSLPACMLARYMLRLYIHVTEWGRRKGQWSAGLYGQGVGGSTQLAIGLVQEHVQVSLKDKRLKGKASELLKGPERIGDVRLREEVERCVASDQDYNPHTNQLRAIMGNEHEYLLQQRLNTLGIHYFSEQALRESGRTKTPDILLEVPVLLMGHLVYWIESKAMFGDADIMAEHWKGQLHGYVTRYGSGCVVYWHGCVLEQEGSQEEEEGIDRQQVLVLAGFEVGREQVEAL